MKTVYKYGCGVVAIFKEGQYYVMDEKEERLIVPPGKYDYIDGFYKNVARVKLDGRRSLTDSEKSTDDRWGLIDINGKEIVPLDYKEIWAFYNKGRDYTKMYKYKKVYYDTDEGFEESRRLAEYHFIFSTRKTIDVEEEEEREARMRDLDSTYSMWNAFEDSEEAAASAGFEW